MIEDVLEAARLAPSGNNKQPWKFMIIKDTKKLDGLFYQDFVLKAPVIIVCAADPTVYQKVEGWDSEDDVRAIRDLSIATSQMVLQATELGLGTCYIGWVKKDKIKEVLGIEKKYLVPYVITLGYPDEEPDARPRKEDITF